VSWGKKVLWEKIKWLFHNWIQVLFYIIGGVCLWKFLVALFDEQWAQTAITLPFALISFMFGNFARFKRFKMWGIEAELWEDKQKEAEDLIERLRGLVSIYSKQIIMGKVMFGRGIYRDMWKSTWQLYDDLSGQHGDLGQVVDLSNEKREMDFYFLGDMVGKIHRKMYPIVSEGKNKAAMKIREEFGHTIMDNPAHNERLALLNAIQCMTFDVFEYDPAGHLLAIWSETKARLDRDFGVEITFEEELLARLQKISELYRSRPVEVTEELISWADK
jgi:hypothetical protein